MKTVILSIIYSIFYSHLVYATSSNQEWVHDFSFDNIQVWKKGRMRLTVEVKTQVNKLSNYNKDNIEEYLKSRNSILKFADFRNFKTTPASFKKNEKEIIIDKNGQYTNSRNKTINFKERHILYPKMSIISMISSNKELTKEDIKDFDEKLAYVMEQSHDK